MAEARNTNRLTMFPPDNVQFVSGQSIPPPSLAEDPQAARNLLNKRNSPLSSVSPLLKKVKRPRSHDDYVHSPTPSDRSQIGQLRHEDPWSLYHPMVDLDEVGDVTSAHGLHDYRIVRLVTRVSPVLSKDWVSKLLRIRHDHIVAIREAFEFTETYLLYEMMRIPLRSIIVCSLRLIEPQIASICAQVLEAIKHLNSEGLTCKDINSTNVLLSGEGVAKLGDIHTCTPVRTDAHGFNEVWSLGRLLLEMAEPKETMCPEFKVGDTLSFSKPKAWSTAASNFLWNTSTVSAEDLTSHRFLRSTDPRTSSLTAHIWLANHTVMKMWEFRE